MYCIVLYCCCHFCKNNTTTTSADCLPAHLHPPPRDCLKRQVNGYRGNELVSMRTGRRVLDQRTISQEGLGQRGKNPGVDPPPRVIKKHGKSGFFLTNLEPPGNSLTPPPGKASQLKRLNWLEKKVKFWPFGRLFQNCSAL